MTVQDLVTVIIPLGGNNVRKDHLDEMIASIPNGVRCMIAANNGKHEMHLAFNEALALVETPYTFIAGSDDILEPGCIEALLEAIGTGDAVYPTMRMFGEMEGDHIADVFSIHRLQWWNFVSGAFLARTEMMRRLGYREVPYEDWDLHARMARAGALYEPVEKAIYHYRIHQQGISGQISAASREITDTDHYANLRYQVTPDPELLLATWQCGNSPGVTYVRSVLPARVLPGVARRTWRADDHLAEPTPAVIIEHPAEDSDAIIAEARKRGRVILADVDDNYLARRLVRNLRRAAKHAPSMRKNAELWATSQPHHKRIVGEIDGVICSTDELASRYETYAKQVFVCPNTVDPKDWPGLHPARMDSTLRIGWAAGAQHGPDATLVEPALRWASKQPGVEVVVIGVQPGWDFEYTQVAFTPSLQTYRDTLSTFDISLAPVLGGDLNECKSDLKFLEATMAGAACIASDEPAYKTIIDGTTGILARTPADFTRAVRHLVGDPDDRFSLAQNAAKYVIRERTTAGARDGYLHVLEQTGAVERVPVAA